MGQTACLVRAAMENCNVAEGQKEEFIGKKEVMSTAG